MIELKALQGQVKCLVEDLRGQVAANDTLRSDLSKEYAEAKNAERVGVTFETWLEGVLDQAAVAWVLACVFVRFCEDNQLVDRVWLGGPESHASVERALQSRQQYVIANPLHNDRHWLRDVAFTHMRGLRATEKIFGDHNPIWRFDISAEAAGELSDFFRRGAGLQSLHSDTLDTRFLGDLYQDLSAHARSTYALLQTPEFVEEFILDRTLKLALDEFGLANISLIDPTCGSGHFLLGAFHRLLKLWRDREPATPIDTLVDRALRQVTGVDINPFAVAIARFRLMVAALKATGRTNVHTHFPVRIATGDSLLDWGLTARHQGDLLAEMEGRPVFAFYSEDGDLLADYLQPGQYTVVVGNPPYITVKDPKLNERYRAEYQAVCYRQYALSVPFAKRFFDLAKRGDHDGDGAGLVGQITANSFMKREFGQRLINDYFASAVELAEVIDTSGAYIPGHGTPTVILVGRNRLVSDRYSRQIRTVLGVRGEPAQPDDPARGLVWNSITHQIDKSGSESEWVSVTDTVRERLAKHPWSLSGGGASALFDTLVRPNAIRIGDLTAAIGRYIHTGSDDSYFAPPGTWRRFGVHHASTVPLVDGDSVRDWMINPAAEALFPYDEDLKASLHDAIVRRSLWLARPLLANRREPGGTHEEVGLTWFEWSRWHPERFAVPLGVAFAGLGTHNHFVLNRDGRIFNRWAPVIKLPEGGTEEDHLGLLGVLNSSTACFWLKQVSHDKGNRGGERSTARYEWEHFYEFTGTKLQEFPLPTAYPLDLSQRIDGLAQQLATVSPVAVAESGVPTRERLEVARAECESIRAQMIALQEELDWRVYQLYGLVDEDLTAANPPELTLGERAFEIVLARRIAAGGAETEWFTRHGSTPITDLPEHWPTDYKAMVQRRIEVIESDRNIGLIERPECKRRWATDGWDAVQQTALRDWLLDKLEAPELWGSTPTPLSIAQLSDRIRHDEDFRAVLDLWAGTDQHDLTKTLGKLLADEHVPFLPADRYKAAGLRKRAQWERTWALQRREDAGEKFDIAVPPKYTSADFVKASYWRNRGKLDVPKERFIWYPRMGRDGDPTELLGWAGWDHLAQARALAGVYLERKAQAGWPPEKLLLLLAGLAELEPWLHQWYTEPQAGFPGSPADFFTGLIDTELGSLGADRSRLTKLRGVEELT